MKRHSRPIGRIRVMRSPPSNPLLVKSDDSTAVPVSKNVAVKSNDSTAVLVSKNVAVITEAQPAVQQVTQVVTCKHNNVDMNVFASKAETAVMIAALSRDSKAMDSRIDSHVITSRAIEAKVAELKNRVDEIKPCTHVPRPKDPQRKYLRISRSDSQQSVTFIEVLMMLPEREEPTPVRVWSYETSENDAVQGWSVMARGGVVKINFSYHSKADIKEPVLDVSFIRVDSGVPSVESTKLTLPDVKADAYTMSCIDIDLDPGTYMVTINSASTIGIIDMWY